MSLVNLAAANWAESVSAVATTAGVLATLTAGWWAWRAAVPHRKLAYSIEVTPLLSSTHSGLTVSLGAERIAHPHTATLKVINVGNREVDASHFHAEPMDFGMNARVVSVLTSSSTDNRRVPPATPRGNTLQIDPYPIHKGQEISYKLLLDGPSPSLTLSHSVSAQVRADNRERRAQYGLLLAAAVVTAFVAAFMWYVLQVDQFEAEKGKEDLQKTIQKDRQEWYEKGKRDAEKAARTGGKVGSESSGPSASPSVR
ncbi:hypothetical protein [Streptomyces sp. NPDC101115]|uniref:hypothetical protein n=1 Tax=Streptomyces sp. NPDC101115 TaxID=3366106 RepID=UPI0038033440